MDSNVLKHIINRDKSLSLVAKEIANNYFSLPGRKTKKTNSEFGRGFVYNMVLFAKHYERAGELIKVYRDMKKKNPNTTMFMEETALSIFFNGAGDHFYEFVVPKQWQSDKVINDLAVSLKKRALHFRLSPCTEKQFKIFMKDFERLSIEIDKKLGAKPIEAQWN